MRILFTAILALLIFSAGCTQQAPPANNTTACTMEAKICPDGTAVGRTGPNCEFAPCPQIVGNDSDVHGCKASAGYSWCETEQKCVREFETPCKLTETQAFGVAEAGLCQDAGKINRANAAYNDNSLTWWFDIQSNRTGCSPACVVYNNRTSEINWRCTGLITYTVKTANSSLGEILVDNGGYTLYVFANDPTDESTCYGTCAANWPPLLVTDTISIPKGLPGEMGAIMRTDNTTQVTYNGDPLYRYAADTAPGETNGQGVGGKWFAAAPSG